LLSLAINHREYDDTVLQEAGEANPIRAALASSFAWPSEANLPQTACTRDNRVAVRPVENRGLQRRQVIVTHPEGRPARVKPGSSINFGQLSASNSAITGALRASHKYTTESHKIKAVSNSRNQKAKLHLSAWPFLA
jgi:hypothetical protein